MITITKEEFLNYSGIDLALELRDLDDDYSKVDRTLNLWAKEYRETSRRKSIIKSIKECDGFIIMIYFNWHDEENSFGENFQDIDCNTQVK